MTFPPTQQLRLAASTLVLSILAVGAARAHPDVDGGRAAYEKGNFKQALVRFKDAEKSLTLTEEELLDLRWYRGASYFALGNSKGAAAEFDLLLDQRPLYLPDTLRASPPLRASFMERSKAWQQRTGILWGEPTLVGAGMSVPIKAPPALVDGVGVFARAAGEATFKQVQLPVSKGVASGNLPDVTLWGAAGSAGAMELVLELRNSRGVAVSRLGDVNRPVRVVVTREQAAEALKILAPAPTPVAVTAPPAAEPAPTVTSEDGEAAPSSPLRTVLLAAGGGLLGLGALGVLAAVVAAAACASAWGAFAYSNQQLSALGGDRLSNRPLLENVWRGGLVGGAVLTPAAAVLLVVGLGGAISGAVVLVLRAVL